MSRSSQHLILITTIQWNSIRKLPFGGLLNRKLDPFGVGPQDAGSRILITSPMHGNSTYGNVACRPCYCACVVGKKLQSVYRRRKVGCDHNCLRNSREKVIFSMHRLLKMMFYKQLQLDKMILQPLVRCLRTTESADIRYKNKALNF